MNNSSQLTSILSAMLVKAIKEQEINIMVTDDGSQQLVVLQLKQDKYGFISQPPVYEGERTITGKAFQLLAYLEVNYPFYTFLSKNDIRVIIVTEALQPQDANRVNSFFVRVADSQETVQNLARIKKTGDRKLFLSAMELVKNSK